MSVAEWGRSLLELLYPRWCVSCGARIGWRDEFLCSACRAALEPVEPGNLCAVCGQPLSGELVPGHRCADCRLRPPPFRMARAALLYRSAAAAAIRAFKYRPAPWLAPMLGEFLERGFWKFFSPEDYDAVLPVPLHVRKRKERGFDQVALLGGFLSRVTGLPFLSGLTRTRYTETQAGLDRLHRRANVRGAFLVRRPRLVAEKKLLLVDDVLTTGATAAECARVLLRAGAVRVDLLSLARTE